MKKSRKREHAKEKHGETCMCRRCRGREVALVRKGTRTRLRDYCKSAIDLNEDT